MTTQDISIELTSYQLAQICSSTRWQHLMKRYSGFNNYENLIDCADKAFSELNEQDWLEAFAGHPMIGDLSTLEERYGASKDLSAEEQSGMDSASQPLLQQLLKLNQEYLATFGFIFIVCATNKSAQQMHQLLVARISNSRSTELLNASMEQRKISHIRMEAYR